MTQVWLYSLLSVFVVSLISLIGLVLISMGGERLKKILLFLVSFAAGALLGDAFLHLLPEAFSQGRTDLFIAAITLSGITFFFILEKIIKWHHCHDSECDVDTRTIGPMILFGDGIHNFIDGLIIAGSYMADIRLGLVTTIAVFAHEIPQEVGDFGVLLHSGYSKAKALAYNFFSALTAVFGAIIILVLGQNLSGITSIIVPFTLGGFIYIAAADLIPELHKEYKIRESLAQLTAFLFGIGAMALLLYIE